jgi:hypothetical protein
MENLAVPYVHIRNTYRPHLEIVPRRKDEETKGKEKELVAGKTPPDNDAAYSLSNVAEPAIGKPDSNGVEIAVDASVSSTDRLGFTVDFRVGSID